MTIQTLFDRMMLYQNRLELSPGGDDVTRGLTAVNLVQDWWEATAASFAKFLMTHETFTTTAGQETTTWPARLLRLDDLWRENSAGAPVQQLLPIQGTGGHAIGRDWPYYELGSVQSSNGIPRQYWHTGPGGLFYWTPKPDAEYTLRAYGLWEKDDYTDADDTFLYPNSVALPVGIVAAKVLILGLDHDFAPLQAHAEELFRPVIRSLRRPTRVEPVSVAYTDIHSE